MVGSGGALAKQSGEPMVNTVLRALLENFLKGNGLNANSSPSQVQAAFDNSLTVADLQAAQAVINAASLSLLAAHRTLRAQKLSGLSSNIDVATPLIDPALFGQLKYYRNALKVNAAEVDAATSAIAANGLTGTSNDAQVARAVIDQARFTVLQQDLAEFRQYEKAKVFSITYKGGDFNFDFDFE